jgi:hypothetical protein
MGPYPFKLFLGSSGLTCGQKTTSKAFAMLLLLTLIEKYNQDGV